jgi:hypothetical protein
MNHPQALRQRPTELDPDVNSKIEAPWRAIGITTAASEFLRGFVHRPTRQGRGPNHAA